MPITNNRHHDAMCCCCIPIRPGVWTLAILGVIGAFWTVLKAGVFLASGITAEEIQQLRAQGIQVDIRNEEDIDKLLAITKGTKIAQLGFGLLHLGLSALLVMGMNYNQPGKLRVWVKVNTGLLVFGGIALFLFFILFTRAAGVGVGLVFLTIAALLVAWQGYYIWVVDKYAGIMEEEEENENGGRRGTEAYAIDGVRKM